MADATGQLAGRVAVVTGASRGIGEAIALRYAMESARVTVAARTVNEGEHKLLAGSINGVVERIEAAGGEALAVRCDLSSAEDRARLIETTEAELGPVDVLVNNGAVTYYHPVEEFPERRFKVMVEVQVYAALHLAQLVVSGMREREWGSIVNMSSGAALPPALDARLNGGTVYGMCKAALERFSAGLAAEQPRIAVNAIQPGLVATPGVEYFGADHRGEQAPRDARRARGGGLPPARRPRALADLGTDRDDGGDDRGVPTDAGGVAGVAARLAEFVSPWSRCSSC